MLRRKGGALLAALLVFHFALAGISAANIPLARLIGVNTASRLAFLYAYLTGTGNCFGFFAPGVISQLQISYISRRNGVELNRGVIGSENPEVSLRLHNLAQQFWRASKAPEVRRSLAASLAGRILSRAPEADEVVIMVRAFVLPSMAEYRNGMRPSWETSYVGTFRHAQGT